MASVSFTKPGLRLSEQDIEDAQLKMGVTFPVQLKTLYIHTNGGQPSLSTCPGDDTYEANTISVFLSMRESSSDLALEDVYINGIAKNIIPKSLIPFAVDWSNNYFCIDENEGIYFYTTDAWYENLTAEENQTKNTRLLFHGLDKFLNSPVDESEAY